ncbi:hypothetical protein CASFOL_039983 [Castilleja foliolosa]|uniref:Alpha/beta hydrolase fold-3 domain-containing protein n=1 Tax=Castilleja foliolosa TaxID=1961234 RepID=A0ABD3BHA1_9LAMI
MANKDDYEFLNLIPNPDGTLTRKIQQPNLPAVPRVDPSTPASDDVIALSRDVPLNPDHKTFIRLFRPRNIPPETKLPLVIYFHGGGFVLLSAATTFIHESCNRMAPEFPAVIASVEYRLAPEHRLPAAYDDAVEAIIWAKNQALAAAGDGACDPWIKELVDFSRVFLMGSSAGGNIVYHAALRAVDLDLRPMKILGLIMNQPFFGGLPRSESEIKYANDPIIPLRATDLMWLLALPGGADRRHEYCDPSAVGPHVEKIERLPKSVVRAYSGDILVDRQKEFVKVLAERGVHVVPQFIDGGHHAVEVVDPKFKQAMVDDVKKFIHSIN